ncbi:MAG TPA: Hsp33 family molecular chaperone HslO [Bdellovibrionales bacterium]|nr:Hsp33 family molecular chaperone HslO [Bdellovibrionales bacterium]
MRTIRIEKRFPDSKWTKYLAAHGNLRAVHTEATSLAQELVNRHGLVGIAAERVTECVVAAILNSSLHDDGEDINVRLEDASHRLRAIVDARPEGAVRGLVTFLSAETMARDSFAVLYTQTRENQQPYLGITERDTDVIDEALDNYFRQSAQIATTSGIVVEVRGNKVERACGMLVQVIGGASSADTEAVNRAGKDKLRALAKDFDLGFGKDLVGVDFRRIEDRELATFCSCSREKIEGALKMSDPGDEKIEKTLEVTCDFCRKQYLIDTAKIWPER